MSVQTHMCGEYILMGIMAHIINDGVRSDPDTSYLKERQKVQGLFDKSLRDPF